MSRTYPAPGDQIVRARDALYSLSANCDRATWVRIGMAFHAAGGSFDDFDQWSALGDTYDVKECLRTWRTFKRVPDGVGPGTLFHMASDVSRQDGSANVHSAPKPVKPQCNLAPGMSAVEIYRRCEAASDRHPYLVQKGASGVPLDVLRVVPASDPLRIMGESMAGALVVPCVAGDGTLSTLQFVPPPEVAARLNANGKPGKMNLPGCRVDGWFTVGKLAVGCIVYIVEGIGQAWACWKATGAAVVVCFGSGNMGKVATALRQLDNTARLVLVPDVGKEQDSNRIAAEVGAAVVAMPEGEVNNFDVNDLMQRDGFDVLAALLESATMPDMSYPVSVAFADELPVNHEPSDELVEGLLTAGDGSVLYGDSNSGKTFLVIDMAASVARGVPWMGKRTEQGMVVYLAAESPASVQVRLQAYQKHHHCRVPNFAIVQSPIDLFNGDIDTTRVIILVQQLERQRGQKVRLIVGDTLARLSAGADENAGRDMGVVIRSCDRIRTECKTHFLLIHHSGKAAAAGARGWSGIRAAVDTEIEISDSPSGRCVEITKQRDLSTKGQRIGFRLDQVALGNNKWGEPATSCVVAPADAPARQQKKRTGEVEGAIVEFLKTHKVGIKKSALAKHFNSRYDRSNVYRAVKTLLIASAIHEAAGMVCIAEVAK